MLLRYLDYSEHTLWTNGRMREERIEALLRVLGSDASSRVLLIQLDGSLDQAEPWGERLRVALEGFAKSVRIIAARNGSDDQKAKDDTMISHTRIPPCKTGAHPTRHE